MLTHVNKLTSSRYEVLTASVEADTLLYISGAITSFTSDMPAKQKVTLYISDDLHRQFKIRSAIDGETMSSIAQRAIEFYLGHADVVESSAENRSETQGGVQGQTHRIHACPKCAAPVALRDDGLALIQSHSENQSKTLSGLERIAEASSDLRSPDEGELVTC